MVAAVTTSNAAGSRAHVGGAHLSRDGVRTVLWLEGEHDIATVHDLTDKLVLAICADDADVVVDLSGVTFIGAATISGLLRGRDFLRRQSRRLAVRSPSPCVMRLLDLCHITDLVEGV